MRAFELLRSPVFATGLLLALFMANPVCAQVDPRYRLEMVTYDLQEDPIVVRNRLDAVNTPGHTATAVQGFSYGVCQAAGLILNSVELGSALTGINGGYPPSAVFLNLQPQPGNGFTIGVVIDSVGIHHLPPGGNQELLLARYVNPGALSSLNLWFCDVLGTPPVEVTVVPTPAYGVTPVTTDGVQLVLPEPPPTTPPSPSLTFKRGDCNRSGIISIPDVIFLLLILFPPPGTAYSPPCADACDVDDNGAIGLSDGIVVLNAMFAVPAIPIPGPSGCILDPTDNDALDCAQPLSCP